MTKYAILLNKQLYNNISQLINADEMVYLDTSDYEIAKAVSRLSLVNVDKFIIDLSGMIDRERFKGAITRFRFINRDAHIILVTPDSSLPEVAQAIELGINDIIEVVPENYNEDQFLQAIEDAIEHGASGALNVRSATTVTIKQKNEPPLTEEPPEKPVKIKERVVTKKVVQYIEKPVEIIREVPIMLGKRIIGVFSCARGSGCTSVAIRIAEIMSEHGHTACIELDGSNDIANEKGHADYIMCSIEEMGSYISDYKYIVIDFGCIFPYAARKLDLTRLQEYSKMYSELQRCDIKVCTAFTAKWHLERLNMLLETAETAIFFNNCNIILDKQENKLDNDNISIYFRNSLTDEQISKFVMPGNNIKNKKRKWKFRI